MITNSPFLFHVNNLGFSWAHYYSAGKAVTPGSVSEVLSHQFWLIFLPFTNKRSLGFVGSWLATGKNCKVWGKRLQFRLLLKKKTKQPNKTSFTGFILKTPKKKSPLCADCVAISSGPLWSSRNVNVALNTTPCSEMCPDIKDENSLNPEETPMCRTELEFYNGCSATICKTCHSP